MKLISIHQYKCYHPEIHTGQDETQENQTQKILAIFACNSINNTWIITMN